MDASGSEHQEGLRSRGNDALADLTNALLDNPLFKRALTSALGAGETVSQAQRRAMDAVGIPSADDLARIERRLRSLSDRLEDVEDQVDELTRTLNQSVSQSSKEQPERSAPS